MSGVAETGALNRSKELRVHKARRSSHEKKHKHHSRKEKRHHEVSKSKPKKERPPTPPIPEDEVENMTTKTGHTGEPTRYRRKERRRSSTPPHDRRYFPYETPPKGKRKHRRMRRPHSCPPISEGIPLAALFAAQHMREQNMLPPPQRRRSAGTPPPPPPLLPLPPSAHEGNTIPQTPTPPTHGMKRRHSFSGFSTPPQHPLFSPSQYYTGPQYPHPPPPHPSSPLFTDSPGPTPGKTFAKDFIPCCTPLPHYVPDLFYNAMTPQHHHHHRRMAREGIHSRRFSRDSSSELSSGRMNNNLIPPPPPFPPHPKQVRSILKKSSGSSGSSGSGSSSDERVAYSNWARQYQPHRQQYESPHNLNNYYGGSQDLNYENGFSFNPDVQTNVHGQYDLSPHVQSEHRYQQHEQQQHVQQEQQQQQRVVGYLSEEDYQEKLRNHRDAHYHRPSVDQQYNNNPKGNWSFPNQYPYISPQQQQQQQQHHHQQQQQQRGNQQQPQESRNHAIHTQSSTHPNNTNINNQNYNNHNNVNFQNNHNPDHNHNAPHNRNNHHHKHRHHHHQGQYSSNDPAQSQETYFQKYGLYSESSSEYKCNGMSPTPSAFASSSRKVSSTSYHSSTTQYTPTAHQLLPPPDMASRTPSSVPFDHNASSQFEVSPSLFSVTPVTDNPTTTTNTNTTTTAAAAAAGGASRYASNGDLPAPPPMANFVAPPPGATLPKVIAHPPPPPPSVSGGYEQQQTYHTTMASTTTSHVHGYERTSNSTSSPPLSHTPHSTGSGSTFQQQQQHPYSSYNSTTASISKASSVVSLGYSGSSSSSTPAAMTTTHLSNNSTSDYKQGTVGTRLVRSTSSDILPPVIPPTGIPPQCSFPSPQPHRGHQLSKDPNGQPPFRSPIKTINLAQHQSTSHVNASLIKDPKQTSQVISTSERRNSISDESKRGGSKPPLGPSATPSSSSRSNSPQLNSSGRNSPTSKPWPVGSTAAEYAFQHEQSRKGNKHAALAVPMEDRVATPAPDPAPCTDSNGKPKIPCVPLLPAKGGGSDPEQQQQQDQYSPPSLQKSHCSPLYANNATPPFLKNNTASFVVTLSPPPGRDSPIMLPVPLLDGGSAHTSPNTSPKGIKSDYVTFRSTTDQTTYRSSFGHHDHYTGGSSSGSSGSSTFYYASSDGSYGLSPKVGISTPNQPHNTTKQPIILPPGTNNISVNINSNTNTIVEETPNSVLIKTASLDGTPLRPLNIIEPMYYEQSAPNSSKSNRSRKSNRSPITNNRNTNRSPSNSRSPKASSIRKSCSGSCSSGNGSGRKSRSTSPNNSPQCRLMTTLGAYSPTTAIHTMGTTTAVSPSLIRGSPKSISTGSMTMQSAAATDPPQVDSTRAFPCGVVVPEELQRHPLHFQIPSGGIDVAQGHHKQLHRSHSAQFSVRSTSRSTSRRLSTHSSPASDINRPTWVGPLDQRTPEPNDEQLRRLEAQREYAHYQRSEARKIRARRSSSNSRSRSPISSRASPTATTATRKLNNSNGSSNMTLCSPTASVGSVFGGGGGRNSIGVMSPTQEDITVIALREDGSESAASPHFPVPRKAATLVLCSGNTDAQYTELDPENQHNVVRDSTVGVSAHLIAPVSESENDTCVTASPPTYRSPHYYNSITPPSTTVGSREVPLRQPPPVVAGNANWDRLMLPHDITDSPLEVSKHSNRAKHVVTARMNAIIAQSPLRIGAETA